MVDTEKERMLKEYNEILDDLKTTFTEKWKMKKDDDATLENFERFRTLGTGAFGRVILVKYKPTSTYYAMKILDKAKLVKSKQIDHTRNEKRILQSINFPFTVFMEFCFKARIENRSNITWNLIFFSRKKNYSKSLFISSFHRWICTRLIFVK